MSGTPQPASSRRARISGTAAAASGRFTVTRTSSEPASASSSVCLVVAATSAVSVEVIDCTTTGAPPPIRTVPTFTAWVRRRALWLMRNPASRYRQRYRPAKESVNTPPALCALRRSADAGGRPARRAHRAAVSCRARASCSASGPCGRPRTSHCEVPERSEGTVAISRATGRPLRAASLSFRAVATGLLRPACSGARNDRRCRDRDAGKRPRGGRGAPAPRELSTDRAGASRRPHGRWIRTELVVRRWRPAAAWPPRRARRPCRAP